MLDTSHVLHVRTSDLLFCQGHERDVLQSNFFFVHPSFKNDLVTDSCLESKSSFYFLYGEGAENVNGENRPVVTHLHTALLQCDCTVCSLHVPAAVKL